MVEGSAAVQPAGRVTCGCSASALQTAAATAWLTGRLTYRLTRTDTLPIVTVCRVAESTFPFLAKQQPVPANTMGSCFSKRVLQHSTHRLDPNDPQVSFTYKGQGGVGGRC